MQVFGVCCEAITRQVSKNYMVGIMFYTILSLVQINYLIDKANATSKGANTVISLVHHFFSMHTFGKSSVHMHADHCSGKIKSDM